MNKKVLATALLCFSLLLSALPVVSAASSGGLEASCEILDPTMYSTDTTLSQEELLALPGYVTSAETSISSDVNPRPEDPENWRIRMPAPVDVMIVVDDDARNFLSSVLRRQADWSEVDEWAYNILEVGDDPFESWFNIDFVAQDVKHWDSPCGTLSELLGWAQQTFGKPLGIDVTYVLTGQSQPPVVGWADEGDAFIVSASYYDLIILCPVVNIWQHEASHLYGAPNHNPGLLDFCVMSYTWMAYTRSWCGECTTTITQNRYRFGSIYIR